MALNFTNKPFPFSTTYPTTDLRPEGFLQGEFLPANEFNGFADNYVKTVTEIQAKMGGSFTIFGNSTTAAHLRLKQIEFTDKDSGGMPVVVVPEVALRQKGTLLYLTTDYGNTYIDLTPTINTTSNMGFTVTGLYPGYNAYVRVSGYNTSIPNWGTYNTVAMINEGQDDSGNYRWLFLGILPSTGKVVSEIINGSGITVIADPSDSTRVNITNSGVTRITAGSGISLSPSAGTGNVQITATAATSEHTPVTPFTPTSSGTFTTTVFRYCSSGSSWSLEGSLVPSGTSSVYIIDEIGHTRSIGIGKSKAVLLQQNVQYYADLLIGRVGASGSFIMRPEIYPGPTVGTWNFATTGQLPTMSAIADPGIKAQELTTPWLNFREATVTPNVSWYTTIRVPFTISPVYYQQAGSDLRYCSDTTTPPSPDGKVDAYVTEHIVPSTESNWYTVSAQPVNVVAYCSGSSLTYCPGNLVMFNAAFLYDGVRLCIDSVISSQLMSMGYVGGFSGVKEDNVYLKQIWRLGS